MAYTRHQGDPTGTKSQSVLEHKELVSLAQKRINSDRLLSPNEIQAMMGIDIAHQRNHIVRKASDVKIERTKKSGHESSLILWLTVGISVGIGVLSLQFF